MRGGDVPRFVLVYWSNCVWRKGGQERYILFAGCTVIDVCCITRNPCNHRPAAFYHNHSVTNIQVAVSATQGTVSATQRTVSETQGTVSVTQGAVSATQGTVSAAEGTVSATQGTVSATQGAVAATQGTVSAAQWNSISNTGNNMDTVTHTEALRNVFAIKQDFNSLF